MILGIPTTLISTTLRHLHSVVLVPADESMKIWIFHKSFPDFLQDHQQCTDSRFHIGPEAHHGDMVLNCLRLVEKLERNPCSLPPFTMNQDTPNCPQLLEDKLGGAVQYACIYWAMHLRFAPSTDVYADRVVIPVANVLENAPLWIEVMSLENHLEEVIHSMYSLLDWQDKVSSFPLPSNVEAYLLILL